MEWPMSEKFDPAPIDKHAEPTKKDAHEGKTRAELEKRLEDSFPASDPVSSGNGPCQQHTTYKDNGGRRLAANEREDRMGLAVYEIFGQAGTWRVRHDGKAENVYETKEAAFASPYGADAFQWDLRGQDAAVCIDAIDAVLPGGSLARGAVSGPAGREAIRGRDAV
jgi:hypothetical protein